MPVSRPNPIPPNELDLVIDFVNTFDPDTGVDELRTPQSLAAWLRDRNLLDSATSVRAAQLDQAIRLREALRTVMLSHNGLEPHPNAASELDVVAKQGQLSVRFAADGSSQLAPRGTGLGAALARLLVPVAMADADGSWQRVKACRADECQWAFYDHSRNRAGVWCDMAVCGNRTKVRAYRRRQPSRSDDTA